MKKALLVFATMLLMTSMGFALQKPDTKGCSYKCSDSKFVIGWDDSDNYNKGYKVSGYKIYKSASKNGTYKLYKTVGKNKDELKVDRESKDKYYYVKAYKGSTLSKASAKIKCDKKIKRSVSLCNYVISEINKGKTQINTDGFGFKDSQTNKFRYDIQNAIPTLTYAYVNYDFYDGNGSGIEKIRITNKNHLSQSNRIKTILGSVKATGDDYQKLTQLHDWLLENCTYDTKEKTVSKGAYGVAVNKKGICIGYAAAFKYLCDNNGLQCKVVYDPNWLHAWNIVQLGGKWYNIDCTWDDNYYEYAVETNSSNYVINAMKYTFFLVSDKEHGINSAFSKCNENYK